MEEGFNVLSLPLIKLQKMNHSEIFRGNAVKILNNEIDAIAFSSANGVRFFAELWKEEFAEEVFPEGLKFFVQGTATEAALEEAFERKADAMPEVFTSDALGELLVQNYPEGGTVLMPSALEVRHDLKSSLKEQGIFLELMPVYETVQAEPSMELVKQICEMPRDSLVLTFFSPSAFLAAKEAFSGDPELLKEIRLVSIGPTTSSMIMESGCRVFLESKESSQKSLVETLSSRLAA